MENMENNTIESTVIDEENNVTTSTEYVDNDGNYYDYDGHYDLANQNQNNDSNSGINPVVAAGAAGAIIGVIALAKNAGKIKKAILTKLNEGSQKALDKIAEKEAKKAEKEAAKEAEKADKEAAETKAEEK